LAKRIVSLGRIERSRIRSAIAGFCAITVAWLLGGVSRVEAQDRADELEGLRDQIQDSRERVTTHEADERALLEQLEEVDRRLTDVIRDRDAARRAVRRARTRVEALEPDLESAQSDLGRTQSALASRAVALYRGGELGPVRVLFSATTLPEMLSRASALRVLVRHDAALVARFGEERDRLEDLRVEADAAVRDREAATANLARSALQLKSERDGKGQILGRVREDRTSERRLLLELEQAAQALEETIRTLGARAASSGSVAGSGFGARRGQLAPPVSAEVSERFGKVVDPEFQTTTLRSGIDFAAPAGATVRSVSAGIVRFAGWFRGYGRIVIVDHGEGFHTISGHLDEIHVQVGTPIDEGESLGTVGETGSLGGPSLYFELRRDGDPIDPEPWLMDPRA
jgi:septal ring factor EnvC (AmiA/AmiB activator)